MKRAASLRFGSLPSYRLGQEAYDPAKLGLGRLMIQKADAGNEGKWVGPLPVVVNNVVEFDSAATCQYPWAMRWSESVTSKIDWVFAVSNATASATRRVMFWEYNRLTGEFAYKGFITLTPSTATNHTVRGFRMTYDTYTVGTVAVSGTAVTGSGSTWSTDGMCVGSRIGFGSTDPAAITTWYEISAVGTNTSITLASSAGTIGADTPYVIEDLRAICLTTNATTTNGGLFVAKGLSADIFTPSGTTIPAATTVDKIRAVYWLKSAATELNIVGNGCGIQPKVDWQNQIIYCGNGTTTQQLFKHNLRAALTVASGASTNQYLFATAVSAALTGTVAQLNNGRVANTLTGPGAGNDCYYFTTSTRIYRTKPLASITTGDTGHITGGDAGLLLPVGGASTSANEATPSSIEYSDSTGLFVVSSLVSNVTGSRQPVITYAAGNIETDRAFGSDYRRYNTTLADADAPVALPVRTAMGTWIEDGLMFAIPNSTSNTENMLYAVPLFADWDYGDVTTSYVITPVMTLTDCDKIDHVVTSAQQILGGTSGKNLGLAVEPHRVSYRTSGMSDNSGTWTALDQSGDLHLGSVSQIQFRLDYKTMGESCIPGRVFALTVLYDDTNTDSRYAFDGSKSSAANKQFAFWHDTAFGGTVPALRVRIYNADTDGLLVDDNTDAPTGTWERTTDGTTWVAWTNADRANATTWIRYTPLSIADNVKARVQLTLL